MDVRIHYAAPPRQSWPATARNHARHLPPDNHSERRFEKPGIATRQDRHTEGDTASTDAGGAPS